MHPIAFIALCAIACLPAAAQAAVRPPIIKPIPMHTRTPVQNAPVITRDTFATLPVFKTPLRANTAPTCAIVWGNWASTASNQKLTNISSTADTTAGIARFAVVTEGKFGLSVIRFVPIIVPATTHTVFIDRQSVPRDTTQSPTCESSGQLHPITPVRIP